MELSFTRFRVYLECPWKYKLKFLDAQPIVLTPPAALGLSLHRALECFHGSGSAGLEALLDCYERQWVKATDGSEDQEKWRAKGRRMLERYCQGESGRRTKIVAMEKEFAYPLGRHTVRGMIDRIDLHPDGRYELIDYKTQLDIKPGDPLPGPGRDGQLRFYALGARRGLSMKPGLLTTYYLAAGRGESFEYDDSGEAALKDEIIRVADQIEAGNFPPNTSFCPRCDFKKICTYYRGHLT